jgi:hypothetical protein
MEVAECDSDSHEQHQSFSHVFIYFAPQLECFQVKIGHTGNDTATADKKDRSRRSYLHRGLKLKPELKSGSTLNR